MIIDALTTDYEVILISLVDKTLENPDDLPVVPGVIAQFHLNLPAFKSRSIAGFVGAFSRRPRSTIATWDTTVAGRINQILTEHDASAAIGTDLRTLRYLTNLPSGIARILDEPDVSPFVVSPDRSSRPTHTLSRRWLRERKYRHILQESDPRLDQVVVASDGEANAYRELSGGDSTVIVNALSNIPEASWSPGVDTTLLYSGALTYQPNLEAVEFLTHQVLPAITAVHPDLQLTVTGKIPDPRPRIADHSQISLTGRLPSLDKLYRQSSLFVAPLMSGTGTRIKLLEAMSYGMPIVSTRKGAEGLPVVHGQHLLLADTAQDFVAAILQLLDDRGLCDRLGANARALIESQFTADAIVSDWREVLADTLARKHAQNNHVQ